MATLFDRLGGEAAIGAVVDQFYVYMLADPVVKHFFETTDMKKQASRQKQFITLVTGGPNKYEGLDMKAAHEKMKIDQKAFDATWNNLNKALADFKVPEKEVSELVTWVPPFRGSISQISLVRLWVDWRRGSG